MDNTTRVLLSLSMMFRIHIAPVASLLDKDRLNNSRPEFQRPPLGSGHGETYVVETFLYRSPLPWLLIYTRAIVVCCLSFTYYSGFMVASCVLWTVVSTLLKRRGCPVKMKRTRREIEEEIEPR
jgi:hypothetical protein